MDKSLYGQYVEERENKNILEVESGFATYVFENDYVYIENIYIIPKERNEKAATQLADQVAEIAREKGYKKMIGSVCPTANSSTESLKVLLGYGMKLLNSTNNMIYFIKSI